MKQRTLAGVLALCLTAGVLVGCASSAVNELCLVYSGGVTQDAEFKELLKPGANNNWIGPGSKTYCYKIDQRTYIASAQEGKGDTGPVSAVSSDTVQMGVEYQFVFTLNQNETVLREFHENIGLKNEAQTDEGWRKMLQENIEPQIERAIDTAMLNFPWKSLYSSEDTRVEFQNAVIENVKTYLKTIIGNDYFCGPAYTGAKEGKGSECGNFTFTVGKPYPLNGEIIAAVESEQTAAANLQAQQLKNEQIAAKAQGDQPLVDMFGPAGALTYKAIESGDVQVMVIPQGTDVAAPAPVPNPEG